MVWPSTRIWRRHLGFAIIAASTSCSHDSPSPSGPPEAGQGDRQSPMYVSNANLLSSASSISPAYATNAGGLPSTSIAVADENVAYVSLQPQTYPAGTTALISNRRSGAAVTTTMVDGGIDPVPVPASAGDSVSIEVKTSDGLTIATVSNAVPSRRPPKIVRTTPPRGKTGVPLNKSIEVVFTEPVAQASLSSSIKLFRGNTALAGSATILQGVTAAVVFKPTSALQPNTNYELVVTTGVRDLDGDPVDSVTRVGFTTGTSIEGPVATITLIPQQAEVRIGEHFQVLAIPRDANWNPLSGHEVIWSSDSIRVATVSSTGLVTALQDGIARINATVDGTSDGLWVRVFKTVQPGASVILAFDSASVAAGGVLQVAAIALDADGNLLPLRLVQWRATNSAVATVTAAPIPDTDLDNPAWFSRNTTTAAALYWADVNAIANGIAKIVATIEGRSDTVVVTVGPSFPIAGFELSRDTATLLLHQTTAFAGLSINSAGARASVPAAQIQWESSNTGVVSVDANGTVTALGVGSATITGHWTNYGASARVTVAQVGFKSMSAGRSHTCAIAADATTYCWGDNEFLQVGKPGLSYFYMPGSTSFKAPTRVAEGFAFAAIAGGWEQSCGLTATGDAYCWGSNSRGALGSNSSEDSWRPQPVSGGLTFVEIQTGSSHTCGLTSGGRAYCWGWNYSGQLGFISQTPSSSSANSSLIPLAVPGEITFSTLSAGGKHTCGLTMDGTAYCWGSNDAGQLGAGDIPNPGGPLRVAGGLTFASITAGESHTCGLTRGGSLYCWGPNEVLGAGIPLGRSVVPVPVASSLNFSLIGAGENHTCAIDTDGDAYCWGRNPHGEIGVGTVSNELFATPQRVVGGLTFDRLSVGGEHTCARTTAGVWYCWGAAGESGGVGGADSGTPLKVLGQP